MPQKNKKSQQQDYNKQEQTNDTGGTMLKYAHQQKSKKKTKPVSYIEINRTTDTNSKPKKK